MNTSTTPDVDRRLASVALVDVRELSRLLGVSIRSCWRLAALSEAGHGSFPRPIRLGPKLARWRVADVDAYLSALAGERR